MRTPLTIDTGLPVRRCVCGAEFKRASPAAAGWALAKHVRESCPGPNATDEPDRSA